jgi:SAM-dependent methyltransferase
MSTGYALAYRFGITPWERYRKAAATSIQALLDREEAERSHPLGRALDLGCGRGLYTHELARRGWEAVGVDNVPRAIDVANSKGVSGATFVVGDVTDLASAHLGTFDFFVDIGCFQGLNSEQRLAEGRGVSALSCRSRASRIGWVRRAELPRPSPSGRPARHDARAGASGG